MQEQHIRGILVTVAAAIVWSTAGVLVKLLHQDAFTILFYRSLYAGLLFLMVFRKEAMVFDRRAFLISVFYAPLLISFVTSTKLTTAANAIFLQYVAPAIVLIIEPRILGTSMKRHNIITVMVCIAGLAFFLIDQDQAGHSWLGDGIALLGGFFSAGMILALRFSNRSQQMSGILLGNIWVVLITMPWFFRSGPATGTEHLMLAYLGFIQIGIGFLLFTYGQRRIPAVESSLIAMLEPILSPLWVLIWYGEKPAVWSLIGGGIILIALAGRMIYLKKIQPSSENQQMA
jgi:drug/metabolite transporter, DME family